MLDEQVVPADHGAELAGEQVVPDIGVAQTGGYTRGAGQGRQEQRLVLAVAVALLQSYTGLEVLGSGALGVGVVLDLVPDEIVEGDSLLPVCLQPPGQLLCLLFNRFCVPVDNRCRSQILIHK